jgi:hypothetical protein
MCEPISERQPAGRGFRQSREPSLTVGLLNRSETQVSTIVGQQGLCLDSTTYATLTRACRVPEPRQSPLRTAAPTLRTAARVLETDLSSRNLDLCMKLSTY